LAAKQGLDAVNPPPFLKGLHGVGGNDARAQVNKGFRHGVSHPVDLQLLIDGLGRARRTDGLVIDDLRHRVQRDVVVHKPYSSELAMTTPSAKTRRAAGL
jgi:hypothetical protein